MEGLLRKAQRLRETIVQSFGGESAHGPTAYFDDLLPPLDPDACLQPLDEALEAFEFRPPALAAEAVEPAVAAAPTPEEAREPAAPAPETAGGTAAATDGAGTSDGGEAAMAVDAGPSDGDDQADIIREIEEVVAQNKIKVTPELFTLKARHSGVKLPVIVNLGAVLLVAAGIGSMALIFNQGQQARAKATVQLKPAEGRLIEEIKKQNDASLAAKQQEIEAIQSKMGDIARQRDTLQNDMNAKVDAKASELKKNMEAQLEAERQRLRAQGLGDTEITKRLQQYEKQKNDEYNALLGAFRTQAEATRKKNEADLKAREDQFNQTLAKANQEKEGIAAEARKREEELRRQFEAQNAQAQAAANQAAANAAAQANQSQAQLNDAASQIKRLAQARDQEKQVGNQIAGYYGTVRDQLRDRKLDQASQTLALLKDYLNSDQVAAPENLRQRRETDLFVVDSLAAYIDRERRGGETTAQSAADAIKAQESTAAALKEAQQRYEAQITRLQQDSAAVQKKLNDLLAAQDKTAREQLAAQDKAGRDQLAARDKLLAERDKLLAERDKAIADLGSQRDSLTRQAAALNADLAALRLNNDGQARTIGDLEKLVADQKSEIERQKSIVSSVSGSQTELGDRIRAMDDQLAGLRKQNEDIAGRLEASGRDLQKAQASLIAVQDERDQAQAGIKARDARIAGLGDDLAKLTIIANTYNGMIQSWNSYVQADRDLQKKFADQLAGAPPAERNRVATSRAWGTGNLLESFLVSDTMRKSFPDLASRISQLTSLYDANGKSTGRPATYLEISNLMLAVSRVDDRNGRLAFVKQQRDAASDPELKSFYEDLLQLLQSQGR